MNPNRYHYYNLVSIFKALQANAAHDLSFSEFLKLMYKVDIDILHFGPTGITILDVWAQRFRITLPTGP
jgi:hypothetical protein